MIDVPRSRRADDMCQETSVANCSHCDSLVPLKIVHFWISHRCLTERLTSQIYDED